MLQNKRQLMETMGWGWIASFIIHSLLVAFLFIRLPDLSAPAADQSVNVELVPPPEPKPESKPEPAQASALAPKQQPEESQAASSPQPQAFESASPEKEPEQPQTHDTPPDTPNKAESAQDSETSTASDENAADGQEASKDATATDQAASAQQESASLDGEFPAVDNPPVPLDKPLQANAQSAAKQNAQQAPSSPTAKRLNKAKKIYSADALSDPRVRQALGKLPPAQRVRQVCSIEALEQVRHQRPDAIPASLAGPKVPDSSSDFNLTGGAFLSRDQWYDLDIKCRVDANSITIKSFSFHIGDAIPRSEWSKRELR